MRRFADCAIACALLLIPALATAADAPETDPEFVKLRQQAESLSGLGTFLDNYIGECSEAGASAECKKNAESFRKQANGKRFYMIVSEDQANMLSPGAYDADSGEDMVNIAPLFAANGYAVTHGAPKKTDAAGNPIVNVVHATGKVGDGRSAQDFSRLFATRGLRAQVIFSPQGVWSLPKKGGGKQYGVKAKVEAVLVTVARTGEPVALWLADRS